MIKCQKCNVEIETYSPMRKWCFECRKKLTVVRARERKILLRNIKI